jgi:hypothetical protein
VGVAAEMTRLPNGDKNYEQWLAGPRGRGLVLARVFFSASCFCCLLKAGVNYGTYINKWEVQRTITTGSVTLN